jgi:hypothetical protein
VVEDDDQIIKILQVVGQNLECYQKKDCEAYLKQVVEVAAASGAKPLENIFENTSPKVLAVLKDMLNMDPEKR